MTRKVPGTFVYIFRKGVRDGEKELYCERLAG